MQKDIIQILMFVTVKEMKYALLLLRTLRLYKKTGISPSQLYF